MSLVVTQRHGDIVEVKLARPPVNALNPALCHDLASALSMAVAEGARGIVLSGGPNVFSAGLDVPHLLSLGDDRHALTLAWEVFFDAAMVLATCPVPVVAAISGHAPAGGCVLALCCDYRVMASGPFRIGLNEIDAALITVARPFGTDFQHLAVDVEHGHAGLRAALVQDAKGDVAGATRHVEMAERPVAGRA